MSGLKDSYVLEGLTRAFPGVLAVDRVDLAVGRGEIHGVIGRNGAGKSVLMAMVAGIVAPSSGAIHIGSERMGATNASPIRAHRMGVSLIPQEPKFARNLSVVDNMFMGRQPSRRFGLVSQRAMVERVAEICSLLSIDTHPLATMGELPIETQQMLAFGKAVHIDLARVVLLDEITASLTQQRKLMLLNTLRDTAVARPDISFTIISHHISEVIGFTDRVTVMRDGRAVATLSTARTTHAELAAWIIGDMQKVAIQALPRPARSGAAAALEVRDLSCGRDLQGLDLTVESGEVVGLAGLEGSGKDAVMETLFGLRSPSRGQILLKGVATRIGSPGQALAHGIALLPKHREAQAVIHGRTVEENTLISSYRQFANRLGFIDARRAGAAARQCTADLHVKTPSILSLINNLSGGNKQKVVINRLALTRPAIFLLNEPTRGVDISAKPPLLKVIRERLAEHSAVLMISESEEELTEVCDRIVIFFKGRVSSVIERDTASFNVGDIYRRIQGVTA